VSSREFDTPLAWLALSGVLVSGGCLLAGVALYLFAPESALTATVLQTGLIVLMATPLVRVFISIAERARVRDWTFVLVTLTVLLEVALAAFLDSRRL